MLAMSCQTTRIKCIWVWFVGDLCLVKMRHVTRQRVMVLFICVQDRKPPNFLSWWPNMEVGSLHVQIGVLCLSTKKRCLSFIVMIASVSVNNKFFSHALKYYVGLFVLCSNYRQYMALNLLNFCGGVVCYCQCVYLFTGAGSRWGCML